MRARLWLGGVLLFLFGVALGTLSPNLRAQTAADPCAAPWEVLQASERPVSGGAGGGPIAGGWHAVKFNRCTGETLVFSSPDHSVSEKDSWYKLAVK